MYLEGLAQILSCSWKSWPNYSAAWKGWVNIFFCTLKDWTAVLERAGQNILLYLDGLTKNILLLLEGLAKNILLYLEGLAKSILLYLEGLAKRYSAIPGKAGQK